MFFERWTNRYTTGEMRAGSRFSFCWVWVGLLLVGCGQANDSRSLPAKTATAEAMAAESAQPHLVGMMDPLHPDATRAKHGFGLQDLYWSFADDGEAYDSEPPLLLPLPPVFEEETVEVPVPLPPIDAEEEGAWLDFGEQSAGQLLPPQQVPPQLLVQLPASMQERTAREEVAEQDSLLEFPEITAKSNLTEIGEQEISEVETAKTQTDRLPILEELDAQQQALAALLEGSSSAATGVLTDTRIHEIAKAKIQKAYSLANRGSYYVARQELIEVLRLLSREKDARQGEPTRSIALAAGLRALREAEDFSPRGTQLEAELDIAVLCASHRTPVAKQPGAEKLLPRVMMDRYLRYAQLQLALSVTGEPAGSMALHALGKINSQLERAEPGKDPLAHRHAIAYQQAALLAHNQNYLAAHELGVLLATTGHFGEAEQLFTQVARRAPNAVVYRNLARVQEKQGQGQTAVASRGYAQQLSQRGATGTRSVQWVSPSEFSRPTTPVARYANVPAQRPTPQYTTAQHPQAVAQRPLPGSRVPVPQPIRR